jgi:hypothetical protein
MAATRHPSEATAAREFPATMWWGTFVGSTADEVIEWWR